MGKRRIERSAGFVHDIAKVSSLTDEQLNLRLLSDRSLYILQNLSELDVTFISRYGEILGGGFYNPVQSGTSEAGEVETAIDIIRRDLNDMSIEDTLACVCDSLKDISAGITAALGASESCEVGTDVETTDGQEGGPLPDPVNGLDYSAADPIVDRKCLAANYIHQSIVAVISDLKLKRADQYLVSGLAFVLQLTSTILVGAILTGPFALLIAAVAGAMVGLAVLLLKASFSLALLETALLSDEAGAICALFEATTADGARTNYTTHLLGEGATSAEIAAIEYFLPNNILNLLFFAWGDSEAAISAVTPTHDCSTCSVGGCQWKFSTEFPGVPTGSGSLLKDGGSRVLTAEIHTDLVYRIYLELETTTGFPGQACDGDVFVNSEIVITSIDPPGTEVLLGERVMRWWNGAVWSTANLPFPISSDPDIDIAQMWLSGSSPFTITCELTPGNT